MSEQLVVASSRRLPASRHIVRWLNAYGIVVAFIAIFIYFAASTQAFLTSTNLTNLLAQNAPLMVVASGMTVAILAGEFDLSVGAIMGLTSVVDAWIGNRVGLALGLVGGVACGAGLGMLNGALVTLLRAQSFLVTLATQFAFVGVALFFTSGTGSYVAHDVSSLSNLSDTSILGLNVKVWIAAAIVLAIALTLRRTPFGRSVFAVGGNPVAARIAGLNVSASRIWVFVLSGMLAGLAGAMALWQTGVAEASGSIGIEFTAITAVVVGGTSIAGGRGGIGRTVVGVLLLAIIADGFTIAYISATYDSLVQGAVILVAVVLDAWLKRRGTR